MKAKPHRLGVWIMIAGASICAANVSKAAGPYDGNWTGSAQGAANSRGAANVCIASVTATVENNAVKGMMAFPRTTAPLVGTIAADGSFTSAGGGITGKFTGSSFEGSFSVPNGYCNPYRLVLKRS